MKSAVPPTGAHAQIRVNVPKCLTIADHLLKQSVGKSLLIDMTTRPIKEDHKIIFAVIRELGREDLKYFQRRLLFADGSIFNGFENLVRHQVIFIGLQVLRRSQFGGWLLYVDTFESRDGCNWKN